jgi:hypothetical protein
LSAARLVRAIPALALVATLALVAVIAPAPGRSATEPDDLTHLTPPPQPPLQVIDPQTIGVLRDHFNALADRTRMLLMLSPT